MEEQVNEVAVEKTPTVSQPAQESKPTLSKPRLVVAWIFFGISLAMFAIGMIIFLTGKSVSMLSGVKEYYVFETWKVFAKGTYQVNVLDATDQVIRTETITIKPFVMSYAYLVICPLAYLCNLLAVTTHKTASKVFAIIFSVMNYGLLVTMVVTILLTINGTFTASSPMNGLKLGTLFSFSSTFGIVAAAVAPKLKK